MSFDCSNANANLKFMACPFEATTNGTLFPSVVGQAGTITNAPLLTAGLVTGRSALGSGIALAGNQQIYTGITGLGSNSAFTIAIWAKWTTTTKGVLVQLTQAAVYPQGDIEIGINESGASGGLYFYARDNSGTALWTEIKSANGKNDGNWHFIVATSTGAGGVATLYWDGNSINSASPIGASVTQTIQQICLGATAPVTGGAIWVTGAIAFARVYNIALAAGDVTDLYNYNGAAIPDTSSPTLNKHPSGVGGAALWLPLAGDYFDRSGNANHGTPINGPTWASGGPYGRAGKFNGVLDAGATGTYVQCGDVKLSNKMSIMAWVYGLTNFTGFDGDVMSIVSKPIALANPFTDYGMGVNPNGTCNVSIGDGTTRINLNSARTVAINSWHHVGMTYDGNILRMAVDGIIDTNTTVGAYAKIGTNGHLPLIGGNWIWLGNYCDTWLGYIADVLIFPRALNQSEITAIYMAGKYYLNNSGLYVPRRLAV